MSMIRSTIRKISSLFRIRRQQVFVCSGLRVAGAEDNYHPRLYRRVLEELSVA